MDPIQVTPNQLAAMGARQSIIEALLARHCLFCPPGPQDGTLRLDFFQGGGLLPLKGEERVGSQLLYSGIFEVVNGEGIPQDPSRFVRILGNMIASEVTSFPTLAGCMQAPAYQIVDGKVVPRPVGWDAASRTLVLGRKDPIPNVDPALPHLKALFSGLVFVSPEYAGNLLGCLVASYMRSALDEFPIIAIDARQKSSGKTQAASAIRAVINGINDEGSITYSGNEQEFEVRLGTYAGRPGPNVIHIDNVRAKQGSISRIRSQALSASVHSHVVRVRRLHRGMVGLHDPVVILTMNGSRVEGDLADKIVQVSLIRPPGASVHRPILPHPTSYVAEHRLAILAEIEHVISQLEIKPVTVELPSWSRFYMFEQVVLQAAQICGLQASFDPRVIRTADQTVIELINLLEDCCLMKDGRVSLKHLSETLQANPGVRELNEMVASSSRSVAGRPAALSEYIEDNLVDHVYRHAERVFRFSLDNGDLVVVQS